MRLKTLISFFVVCIQVFSALAASEINYPRYIAHAGGMIDGYRYTNSLDALDLSYANGFRMFELDLIYTSDKVLVAAHDWNYWKNITSCDKYLPVTKKHFLEHLIYDTYTPLTIDEINEWFKEHPDAILVTDKINSPRVMKEQFVDPSRVLMELFTKDAIKEAQELNIPFMMSEGVLPEIKSDSLAYVLNNNIQILAVSRLLLHEPKTFKFLQGCKQSGVKIYVFALNDEYDEKYVLDNEMQYIYGMYADRWIEGFEMVTTIPDIYSDKLMVSCARGILSVKSDEEIKSIFVYNISGKLIANYSDISSYEFQTFIDNSGGMLIVKIQTTDSIEVLKISAN